MVSMLTSSSLPIMDDDDEDDEDFLPVPTSMVPFSSHERIPVVVVSVPKEGELIVSPSRRCRLHGCIDCIDPTTDTGHTIVQHDEIEIAFDSTRVEDDHDDEEDEHRPSDEDENTNKLSYFGRKL